MAKLAFVSAAMATAALILALWMPRQVRAQSQCVFDATREGYPGDCSGGPAQYELAYYDDTGYNDTGEQALEYIVCVKAHVSCASGCPFVQTQTYYPQKPSMWKDESTGYLGWDEYNEVDQGAITCSDQCANGYTESVIQSFGSESSEYQYYCNV